MKNSPYLDISLSSNVIAMLATTCHSEAAITSDGGLVMGSHRATPVDAFSEM